MVAPGGTIPPSANAVGREGLRASRASIAADLVSGLAHEVRNPLNAMSIHLEVLADKLRAEQGSVPPKLQKNLEGARAQIGRVDEIVRRFADFVTGRLEPGPADVASLLSWAQALCEHPFKRGGVTLATRSDPAIRARTAPEDLLHLLVATLLAWGRVIGRGGRLSVSASAITGWIVVSGEVEGLDKEPDVGEVLGLAEELGVDMETDRGFSLRIRQAD